PTQLRDELGVAQTLRDPPAGACGVHDRGADRDRPRQRATAHLVERDDQIALLEQHPLQAQGGRDDGHFGSGTARKTSSWVSISPNRSSGHVVRNARPTAPSSGTKPPPGSPWWARESCERSRLSPITQIEPAGTVTSKSVLDAVVSPSGRLR